MLGVFSFRILQMETNFLSEWVQLRTFVFVLNRLKIRQQMQQNFASSLPKYWQLMLNCYLSILYSEFHTATVHDEIDR